MASGLDRGDEPLRGGLAVDIEPERRALGGVGVVVLEVVGALERDRVGVVGDGVVAAERREEGEQGEHGLGIGHGRLFVVGW
ncbi:hypothetical protein [Nannocystis exedens]|uniref:hypothetical protein n=1 Tax=Nannocystis exedens TaxID=54 RepID=UPI0011602F51|nr:hypothetical protein [Nannocystis exedens]